MENSGSKFTWQNLCNMCMSFVLASPSLMKRMHQRSYIRNLLTIRVVLLYWSLVTVAAKKPSIHWFLIYREALCSWRVILVYGPFFKDCLFLCCALNGYLTEFYLMCFECAECKNKCILLYALDKWQLYELRRAQI